MASTIRTLTVNLVGRSKNLERSFKRVAKGSELMSEKLMRATRVAGVGFGALAGVAIGAAVALKPMIDKAASMEEALSKNQLLLGESAKAVEAFADTASESFGISELAALQATGVFASLGDAMGMSEEASASMATTLTGLAGDLSSLHDVSVETALTALRAGLIGEAEPLRKLGILLDAATIKNKALSMGLIKNTRDALTPAIKSQAAYALIMEKGATAMGDFARTSDSATNVSKRLANQWEKVQIQIGTALLPGLTALVAYLVNEVMPAIEEFFDDPSWAAMGKLSADALTSEFSKTILAGFVTGADLFINPIGKAVQSALPDVLKGAAGAGASWAWSFIFGVDDTLKSNAAQEALKAAFEGAGAAGAFDRPLDQRGGGGTPATDIFNMVADLENAAEAITTAVTLAETTTAKEPFPGLSQSEIDALTESAVAAAIAAALAAATTTAATTAAATTGPGVTQLEGTTGGSAVDVLTGAGPSAMQLAADAEILAWLGTSGAQQLIGHGPPNIVINAPAVSGKEIVDELGKYIDMNGPLGPQFVSQ